MSTEQDKSPESMLAPAALSNTLRPGAGASAPSLPNRAPALPPRPNPPELPPRAEAPRPLDLPHRTVEPVAPPAVKPAHPELRQLLVGRDISLSGEISSCDRVVVEGSIEANLTNCQDIEVAQSGLFKGSATIESAEIRGRFEGNLTVKGRLLVRATGRVAGTIRYGQIEIECGGQISGEIQANAAAAE